MTAQWKNEWKDYYKILGVDRTATEQEIKKAYRKKAMENHPDINPNANEDDIKLINEAYEILRHEQSKKEYDTEYQNRLEGKVNAKPKASVNPNQYSQRTNESRNSTTTNSQQYNRSSDNSASTNNSKNKEESQNINRYEVAVQSVVNLYKIWKSILLVYDFKNEEEYNKVIELFKQKIQNVQMDVISLSMEDYNVTEFVGLIKNCDILLEQIPKNYRKFKHMKKKEEKKAAKASVRK